MDASPDPQAESAALAEGLRMAFGRLKRRLREQAGEGDLTTSQAAVMLRLETQGEATTSSLARAEAMRPQSMAAVVAALEAAGLIAGAPDPTDGRRTLLAPTDAGRQWLQHARAARQDWLSRTLLARFSAEERADLARSVGLLQRLLED